MIQIGLIGAHGRLGKAIAAIHPVFPILRDTPRTHLPCNVLIDVSSPDALKENLSANLPLVIGTTGHKDFSLIEKAALRLPIFFAPNFSLGIALLHHLTRLTAAKFPSEIDLLERHHKLKKDSPSGTALSLAKDLPNARIHSVRAASLLGEHTLTFTSDEEEITLSHKTHSRNAYAKGAIAAAYFLQKQPPGLYGMEHL